MTIIQETSSDKSSFYEVNEQDEANLNQIEVVISKKRLNLMNQWTENEGSQSSHAEEIGEDIDDDNDYSLKLKTINSITQKVRVKKKRSIGN